MRHARAVRQQHIRTHSRCSAQTRAHICTYTYMYVIRKCMYCCTFKYNPLDGIHTHMNVRGHTQTRIFFTENLLYAIYMCVTLVSVCQQLIPKLLIPSYLDNEKNILQNNHIYFDLTHNRSRLKPIYTNNCVL